MQPKILQSNYKLNVSKEEYGKLCESAGQVFAKVPGLLEVRPQ
jgi:hypothetical protein